MNYSARDSAIHSIDTLTSRQSPNRDQVANNSAHTHTHTHTQQVRLVYATPLVMQPVRLVHRLRARLEKNLGFFKEKVYRF